MRTIDDCVYCFETLQNHFVELGVGSRANMDSDRIGDFVYTVCNFRRDETMNSVILIGRLTKDPEIRWAGEMAIATFTVVIDRPTKRGEEKKTDFPRVTVFGKQAENCEKYLAKGRLVGIQGRLQTGSFTNRNGDTVYTTDVIANGVEFLEWGDKNSERQSQSRTEPSSENVPEGFMAMSEDDCPF